MSIERRNFLRSAAALAPAAVLPHLLSPTPAAPASPALHPVGAGGDRYGHPHSLGFSSLAFKVASSDTGGAMFIIEHRNLLPGSGPALHLHYSQDEWFYVMDGEVAFQVGGERISLRSGDSVLGPRGIPHTFSPVGSPAHMLVAFAPAGKMEQYFVDASAHPELAATADFMNRYEVKWLGPSPFWKA